MRLDKYLERCYGIAKGDRKRFFRDQLIRVDGKLPTSLRQNIDSQLQRIELEGRRLDIPTEVYYLMYKPEGVITANRDEEKRTVLDLISPEDKVDGLYPLGRLDRFTSGLLLLTNNGPLGLRMLHPDHHVAKTYYVEVKEALRPEMIQAFKEGVMIDRSVLCQPANLTILSDYQARVTLSEGKYHQVKKMFLSVGCKVTHLKRETFGPFRLDSKLKPGEYRLLNQEELALIKPYLD